MRVTGHCETGIGNPVLNGTYAVEVFFGWKLMDWKDDAWWHTGGVGRWDSCKPLQWVGPLPQSAKTKMEFDL